MSGYVTASRYDRILTLPVSLPQTELRRGRSIQAAVIRLGLGEEFELRSLTLHLLKILTPGAVPQLNNTALGLVSAGVYQSPMLTGSAACVKATTPGAFSYNPSAPARFSTPGTYTVIVSNNAANIDLAVILTGSVKWIR